MRAQRRLEPRQEKKDRFLKYFRAIYNFLQGECCVFLFTTEYRLPSPILGIIENKIKYNKSGYSEGFFLLYLFHCFYLFPHVFLFLILFLYCQRKTRRLPPQWMLFAPFTPARLPALLSISPSKDAATELPVLCNPHLQAGLWPRLPPHPPSLCLGGSGAALYHPAAALCTCALLLFPQTDLLGLSFPFTAALPCA